LSPDVKKIRGLIIPPGPRLTKRVSTNAKGSYPSSVETVYDGAEEFSRTFR
jgi:hypothetical protein